MYWKYALVFKVSNKTYKHSTARFVDIDPDKYALQANWLDAFVSLCEPSTMADFDKHIGDINQL